MSALPVQREGADVTEADLWETEALEALDKVDTPEAAEDLLRKVKFAHQAIRLSKLGAEREQRWGRIRLMAERRYGELLGPAKPGRPEQENVTSSHVSTPAERKAAERAREVAEAAETDPQAFEEYLDTDPAPTRAGLLREVGKGAHVANNSGDNEWYTPAEYITAARNVMGAIDLDPASNQTANEVVGAADFFSLERNGLRQEWAGRVWMNPPYARPHIDNFCAKLAEDFTEGRVTEACVLTNNATETGWFHLLGTVATAVCLPRRRIRFWHPDKENAAPLQGQSVLYLGENVEAFMREFSAFGLVAVFP